MAVHYIALDVHCAFSEMAVLNSRGDLMKRDHCATTIADLATRLAGIPRPRRLTFEEGPLADWLARELRPHVEELIVCEPRRNQWIAKDSDKDDPIDVGKLADLYRGGYLKAVHQPATLERSLLKQEVLHYHDQVRERVRHGNQLVALFRRHGVFTHVSRLIDPDDWHSALRKLPDDAPLRERLGMVRQLYELLLTQEDLLRKGLVGRAQNLEPVRRFKEVPGMGWIRSVTFFALIDTPHRFRQKRALWRYAGIGLQRRHSGAGATRTQLCRQGNRRLKDVLLGAAQTAIQQGENALAEKYEFWHEEQGLHAANAKRNVARAVATTLWHMWKSGQTYAPGRV
jgi:transposase